LPDFYLQAALWQHPELNSKPVALIDDRETKAAIIQLNAKAAETGVQGGMTPSQGLARSLELIIKTRNHPNEKRIHEILLHFAGTLAPFVEITGPGISTVRFTDGRRVKEKVSIAIEQLADNEILAQAGLGPTAEVSFLAAHFANPILEVNHANDFLTHLPIETLTIN